MVLNVLQPLNATFVPSSYPAPVAPDSFTCNDWYAHPQPPKRADCQIAFEQLPTGSELEPFSYHFSTDDPNRLPIFVEYGTCEMWFYTSGEQYRESDPIVINPRDIRNMAGWIIDQCVAGERTGGAIMKGAEKATDWILDPHSGFPHALMPPSTTFYSLSVWNDDDLTTESDWNPGNFDPNLGLDIAVYAGEVAKRAPAGSVLRNELQRRYILLMEAASRMEPGTENAWWDCDPLLDIVGLKPSVVALRNMSTITRKRISALRPSRSKSRNIV